MTKSHEETWEAWPGGEGQPCSCGESTCFWCMRQRPAEDQPVVHGCPHTPPCRGSAKRCAHLPGEHRPASAQPPADAKYLEAEKLLRGVMLYAEAWEDGDDALLALGRIRALVGASALPATFKYPGPDMERDTSSASPTCSQCTVEPATHCARCVAAAEVHARRMGQLDQIGQQVESIGRAIDSRDEQRTGSDPRTAFSAGYKARMFKAPGDDSGIDGAYEAWSTRCAGPSLLETMAKDVDDAYAEAGEAMPSVLAVGASPNASPANEGLSRQAQSFAYEHRDCNPYGASTINDLFRLLVNVRDEGVEFGLAYKEPASPSSSLDPATIEACAVVCEAQHPDSDRWDCARALRATLSEGPAT